MVLSRREEKFRVKTDASGHAIGGVLSQEQEGKWKPIVFFIKDDTTSKMKLRNLQQGTTSNSGSFGQIETISARCHGNIQDLDGL